MDRTTSGGARDGGGKNILRIFEREQFLSGWRSMLRQVKGSLADVASASGLLASFRGPSIAYESAAVLQSFPPLAPREANRRCKTERSFRSVCKQPMATINDLVIGHAWS